MTISTDDRIDLLRERVVVHAVRDDLFGTHVAVTGPDEERARALVTDLFETRVDVAVCGDRPRGIHPQRCGGYVKRGARTLELRYELLPNEHVDEILVAEDEDRVVVLATVCAPVDRKLGDIVEYVYSVHLQRSIGDRIVLDAVENEPVQRLKATRAVSERTADRERAA
jgi:hypothetical protein